MVEQSKKRGARLFSAALVRRTSAAAIAKTATATATAAHEGYSMTPEIHQRRKQTGRRGNEEEERVAVAALLRLWEGPRRQSR